MTGRLRRNDFVFYDEKRVFVAEPLSLNLGDTLAVEEALTWLLSILAADGVVARDAHFVSADLAAGDGVEVADERLPFGIGKGAGDAVYAGESLSRIVAFLRSWADTAYGGEVLGRDITLDDLTDGVTAAVVLTWHMMLAPITEDVGAADAVSDYDVGKALAETVRATEALAKALTLAAFADGVVAGEVVTPVAGLVFADSVTAGEDFSRTASFVRSLAETVRATEALTKAMGKTRSDGVWARDALRKAVSLPTADTVLAGDAIGPLRTRKALADAVVGAESLYALVRKALADTVRAGDALGGSGLTQALADTVRAGDALSRVVSFVRAWADAAAATDTPAKAVTREAFTDGVTAEDAAARAVSLHTFFERVRARDVSPTRAASKTLADVAYAGEVIDLPSLLLTLADLVVVSEAIVSLLRGLALADTVWAGEALSFGEIAGYRIVLWGDAEGRATGQILRLVEGDTLPVLVFLLTDAEDGPYDLVAATVTLRMWDRDETVHINAPCTVSDVAGTVIYDLISADTDTTGEFWACLVIEDGVEQYTSESFVVRIRPHL